MRITFLRPSAQPIRKLYGCTAGVCGKQAECSIILFSALLQRPPFLPSSSHPCLLGSRGSRHASLGVTTAHESARRYEQQRLCSGMRRRFEKTESPKLV